MHVGILGSGIVARTLAAGFLRHGHSVMLGTRHPSKLESWARANPAAQVASPVEAAEFAELAVLAVKGTAALEVMYRVTFHLDGKPVIDTTNPIADEKPVNGVFRYFTSLDESLLERLQHTFRRVEFVKAFNSVGATCMVNPHFEAGRPTMFICGRSPAAKRTVCSVLDAFGWDAEDLGEIEAARAIEPLGMLWCIPALTRSQWTHAFKLLRT